jgi:hypothetical protein
MEIAFESCAAVTTPSDDLRSKLEARGNAYDVEQIYSCELPINHVGPHYSIGQSLEPDSPEGDDLWLRWKDGDDSILESKPMCPALHVDGDECGGEGICMLYDGHPGPHTDECASRWLVRFT